MSPSVRQNIARHSWKYLMDLVTWEYVTVLCQTWSIPTRRRCAMFLISRWGVEVKDFKCDLDMFSALCFCHRVRVRRASGLYSTTRTCRNVNQYQRVVNQMANTYFGASTLLSPNNAGRSGVKALVKKVNDFSGEDSMRYVQFLLPTQYLSSLLKFNRLVLLALIGHSF